MKNNRKSNNFLKAAIVISITFTFIMPGSSAIFSASTEKQESAKSVENYGNGNSLVIVDIYVDDDNTEGPWDGSIDYPYQYIWKGIENADPGNVIYVFNGTYHEDITIFKSIDLLGEDKDITIIDGGGCCNVVEITADGVHLRGFTIQNSGNNPNNAGISVNSKNNNIYANNIVNNNYGIRLIGLNNTIFFNNFIDNIQNAYDEANNHWDNGYAGNYWDDYTGVDENEDGVGDTPYSISENETYDWYPLIHWYGSVKNLDTKEIFLTIQSAIDDYDIEAGHTIFVKNDIYHEHVVIHKPINLIGENKHETIIDGRGFGTVARICDGERDEYSVYLTGFTVRNSGSEFHDAGIKVTSDENMITENIVEDNFHGLYLKHSSDDNEISRNLIRNNEWNGIYVKSSCAINDGNIIFENTIENNSYAGIAMEDSSYNYIYHNNFIKNLHNAYDDSNNIWDDDYPSGGNYWDDYTGGDANGDGIGDTPYEIPDGINQDRYPLMEPTTPPKVEIVSPQNGLYLRNLRLLPGLFRQRTIIFGAITIEVEASDYSGIEKVEFYLDDGSSPERIVYEEPYSWTWKGNSLFKTKHKVVVVAYDNAGNYNLDVIDVRKFF